jgi:predicted transposase YdaD
MSELNIEINDLLDNTKFSVGEIANTLDIPIEMVEAVVLERWENILES